MNKKILQCLIVLLFISIVSCNIFENPDNNPNRPKPGEWGKSSWDDARWGK